MTAIVPCMGGWCKERSRCAHYYADPLPNRLTIERLCEKGKPEPEPITDFRQAYAKNPRFAAWAARVTRPQEAPKSFDGKPNNGEVVHG